MKCTESSSVLQGPNVYIICQQAVGKVWARSRPTPPGSRTPRLEHRGRISGGSSGSWTFPGCLRSDWWGRLRCSWCWLTARKPATRNGADLQRIIASRDTVHPRITTLSLDTQTNLHDFNSYAEHTRRYLKHTCSVPIDYPHVMKFG